MREDPWYAERRERWRPDHVRLLLIAESPPDPGGGPRRYFYDDDMTAQDSLFREIARTLLGAETLKSGAGAKPPWLSRLKSQGVFLIDLAPIPVNRVHQDQSETILIKSVPECLARVEHIGPDGIILIKKSVFTLLHAPMLRAGFPLLNTSDIPFPGSGQQKRFREAMSRTLGRLSEPLQPPQTER